MNRYSTVNITEHVGDYVEIWSRTELKRWINIPDEEWKQIVLEWCDHYRNQEPGPSNEKKNQFHRPPRRSPPNRRSDRDEVHQRPRRPQQSDRQPQPADRSPRRPTLRNRARTENPDRRPRTSNQPAAPRVRNRQATRRPPRRLPLRRDRRTAPTVRPRMDEHRARSRKENHSTRSPLARHSPRIAPARETQTRPARQPPPLHDRLPPRQRLATRRRRLRLVVA